MTDPSDDGVPPLDGSAANVPTGSPASTIADRDGGVARRLIARCRIAAAGLLVVAGLALLFTVLRTWSASSGVLALFAAAALTGAAMLARRAGLWSSVARAPLAGVIGADAFGAGTSGAGAFGAEATVAEAIVGPPRRLSPGIPGAPLKRRLGAMVVPIHTAGGPRPGGGALVVHARADGIELTDGDRVRAWPARRVGFGPAASARLTGSTDQGAATLGRASGRWVLYRAADGAVFLATTRVSDTW